MENKQINRAATIRHQNYHTKYSQLQITDIDIFPYLSSLSCSYGQFSVDQWSKSESSAPQMNYSPSHLTFPIKSNVIGGCLSAPVHTNTRLCLASGSVALISQRLYVILMCGLESWADREQRLCHSVGEKPMSIWHWSRLVERKHKTPAEDLCQSMASDLLSYIVTCAGSVQDTPGQYRLIVIYGSTGLYPWAIGSLWSLYLTQNET